MNVWASGPDVAEAACLRGAGFRPLGRVTGCIVLNFAWWNDEEIAAPRRMRVPYPKEFSLNLHRRSEAYARLLYQGRRAAAERMAARCAALDGDGVVGVAIDVAPYIGDKRALQFTATGTAVRAAGSLRTSSPFLAGVSAQDFTKLMMAGWVPVDIAVGTACTWRNWSAGRAPRRWDDDNRELGRWTEAVATAREQARGQMQADAARRGADGVTPADTDMHVTVRNLGPWRGAGGYCVAEATYLGTAISQFRSSRSQQFVSTVKDLRPETESSGAFKSPS
jgi:uncharacterized protein YbjQ (UPF0145 family)